jgi:hypothetical protein
MMWAALPALVFAAVAAAQTLPPDLRAKVDARAAQLRAWGTDPTIVAAVKAHNAGLSAEEKAMTNQKWTQLTVLDPFVRAYTRNPAGQFLKSKKDAQIAECFVSGADGTKVAFLSKTTAWSHAGKDKHRVPMSGKVYVGPASMDDSTGLQLVQVGLPVLDGGRPIGSIVVGLAVSRMK